MSLLFLPLGIISFMIPCGFQLKTKDIVTHDCKSSFLMDYESGQCLYSENEYEKYPIASICKVMTLILSFDALHNNTIQIDDQVPVSQYAESMGGSQVFLSKNENYLCSQLIKSIIICSANDSCVAMAEHIAGSEEEFVALMNQKANEIGCVNTLFANCTGLPKLNQYSCAKDVAIMYQNLIQNDAYFDYSKIWMEDFNHANDRKISMSNTNKLLKSYKYCDAGKTGFTNDAGFCFVSTAVKDHLRLISVVLGSSTSKNRFDSTTSLFEYGFANYKSCVVLDKNIMLNDYIEIKKGKLSEVPVYPEKNVFVLSSVGSSPNVSYITYPLFEYAPIEKGQVVGKIEVYLDNKLYKTISLLSSCSVKKADYGDYFKDISENWAL